MSDSPRRFPTPLLLTGVMGVLILIALLTFTLMRSWDNAPDQSALLGKPAPNFSLPLLHDPSLQISNTDLAGAPTCCMSGAAGVPPAPPNSPY